MKSMIASNKTAHELAPIIVGGEDDLLLCRIVMVISDGDGDDEVRTSTVDV